MTYSTEFILIKGDKVVKVTLLSLVRVLKRNGWRVKQSELGGLI